MTKYAVAIAQTTGKTVEESLFEDLGSAQAYFHAVSHQTSYERVLILLLEKPTPYEECILDVNFKEGISYVGGRTSKHSTGSTDAQ